MDRKTAKLKSSKKSSSDSVYVPTWKDQKSNVEEVMAAATNALEKISSRCNDSLKKNDKVDEDRNLVEMICTMLRAIPNGMAKAMLRLELQQKIIQIKYSGYQAVHISSVPVAPHLHQGLQASTNNYFGFMSPPSVPSHSEDSASSTSPYRLFEFLGINRDVIEDLVKMIEKKT